MRQEEVQSKYEPLVVSIVLAFGAKDQLMDCIKSLEYQVGIRQQIVVVQNGAESEMLDDLEHRFQNLATIRNGVNVGSAAGRNLGIRWAVKHHAEYLFFADNDATFAPDALSNLLAVTFKHPEIGFLSCVVWRKSDPRKIFTAGALIEPPLSTRHLYEEPVDSQMRNVDFAPSCALLVPVNTVKSIGLMDESLFVYDEDIDWCLNGKAQGFNTVVVSASAAYHDIHAGKMISPLRVYYGIRNRLVVFQRHNIIPESRKGVMKVMRILLHNWWYHQLLGKGELSVTCSYAYLLGILHSQFGRLGAAPLYLQKPNANFFEGRLRRWVMQSLIWRGYRMIKQVVFTR